MLKNKLKLDDALDVWGVHGVGGVLGCICTGLFATTAWNPAGLTGSSWEEQGSFSWKLSAS